MFDTSVVQPQRVPSMESSALDTPAMDESVYWLEVPDVRMTLAHRILPLRGTRAVMARHWFHGGVAVAPSRLIASSAGLIVLDVIRPRQPKGLLELELPTPGCLELHVDAERCTDHLHGYWELRIFSGRAGEIADLLSASA
ncbi:hypothetical protein [Marinobacterium mangrovicola]|uniref:Uncharacterized protein n=1 Tax=Marinobacterium mangrovicola TaxID=1476959 RepID=A0A4R1GR26_9GAMM|nr:hypothetical protein [Marinobacterium mangrovicola]TCK08619.1 hypothetical protein CLV83_0709 [Marinobacterium mangrovicola]